MRDEISPCIIPSVFFFGVTAVRARLTQREDRGIHHPELQEKCCFRELSLSHVRKSMLLHVEAFVDVSDRVDNLTFFFFFFCVYLAYQ